MILLWCNDMAFNGNLHRFDDEIHAAVHSDCIVVR